ncbi:MAG: CPBP family intramembrane metalloprotease [Clostridia bacterium]|nr:CPBP family intramembrane metalloprotease [Clostridia bacterium]
MKKKIDKRTVSIGITAFCILLLLIYQILGAEGIFGEIPDDTLKNMVDLTVTRAIGSAVFVTILIYLGYRVVKPSASGFGRALLFSLPAFLVVINNLPIYPLVTGLAAVTSSPSRIALLAAECLFVGLFEETCFRGVVLLGFLEKRRATVSGRFWAIVLSSAVFGLIHAVNLFFGSGPIAVLMQIGYSFLIGAMCSVVLMKTSNIWLCVVLHALFNFCGALVPDCGEGTVWEPITITVTVIIAVLTTVYMIAAFLRLKSEELDKIYEKPKEKTDERN